jgi:hypothetical protein
VLQRHVVWEQLIPRLSDCGRFESLVVGLYFACVSFLFKRAQKHLAQEVRGIVLELGGSTRRNT